MDTRRVKRRTGTICYEREVIALSSCLGGWSVGLAAIQPNLLEVWFANLLLGHLDTQTYTFVPADPSRAVAGSSPLADSATLHRPKGWRRARNQQRTKL